MASESFDQWAAGRHQPRYTEWLRQQCEPAWSQTVGHRFVTELAAGTVSDSVMRRYLVQDYSFLNSFVRLVASAVVKSPDLAGRIPLCQFLGMVTSDENTYFQRAFDALGVAGAERTSPVLTPPTIALHSLMAEAVRAGSYAEALAPLVVFEWIYLSWAASVAGRQPPRFEHREWIELHANPAFAGFVDWLRQQLDREGPMSSPESQERIAGLFRRAVGLEQAFFEAAYKGG